MATIATNSLSAFLTDHESQVPSSQEEKGQCSSGCSHILWQAALIDYDYPYRYNHCISLLQYYYNTFFAFIVFKL
jgi:hypothetical protein